MNSSLKKRTKHTHSILFILIGIAAIPRFLHILSDPPAGEISQSGAFLTDEGIYGYNAIQWVRTGTWITEGELNPGAVLPVWMTFQMGILKLFGVGLQNARIGSILCGLIMLILLVLLLKQEKPLLMKIILLLAAVNYPLMIYNRIAIAENLILCLLVTLAICLRNIAQSEKTVFWTVFFWLLMGTGILIKPIHIFFIIPFITELRYLNKDKRIKIVYASIVTIFVLGFSLVSLLQPFKNEWAYFYQLNLFNQFASGLKIYLWKVIRSVVEMPFFAFMPVLFPLAVFMFFRLFPEFLRNGSMKFFHRMVLSWFGGGWIFLILIPYAPPRYWLILIPPVLFMAGLFVSEFIEKPNVFKLLKIHKMGILILVFVILQMVSGFYRYLAADIKRIIYFFPVLGLIPLLFILFNRLQTRIILWSLIGFILLFHSHLIFRYHKKPEYTFINMIRHVGNILEKDTSNQSQFLAGDIASVVAFEYDIKAIDVMYRKDQLKERLNKFKPGYLLLEDSALYHRIDSLISQSVCQILSVEEFSLMHNYHHGQNTVLYQIIWH